MPNCIFCQIIQGKKPAQIIYEDDHTLCFLSKEMEVYGHTLIIPKQHFKNLYDIPPNILCKLTEVIQILTKEYKSKINATGMNLLHASGKAGQQSVPHFHFHLLPRFKNDGLNTWPKLKKRDFDGEEVWDKLNLLPVGHILKPIQSTEI